MNERSEYVAFCVRELAAAHNMLRSLYQLAVDLRASIIKASLHTPLDSLSLDALKLKILAIQSNLEVVSKILQKPRLYLVFDTNPWW